MASLVDISNIKFDGVCCLITIRFTGRWSLTNVYIWSNGLLVFDGPFMITVIRILKPDVKVIFLSIGLYILERNSILSFYCNKGLRLLLAPNRHHTVLPVGDIKGNNYIVLCFLTSHLLGFNFNIAYHRRKGSFVCDVQFAVISIICPYTIGMILFPVGKQSCYIESHIALFCLYARIRIGNLYRGTAIDARIEL